MSWIWVYTQASGEPATSLPQEAVTESFNSQEEAEEYLGQTWQKLYDSGVAGVSLFDGTEKVYGPMSLAPPS